MPGTNNPAVGAAVVAAAQVQFRKTIVLRGAIDFSDVEPARTLAMNVNGLSKVYFNLFLYPIGGELGTTYNARNVIDWMPVFSNPGDLGGFFGPGIPADAWLPMASPYILPVGVPIAHQFDTGGAEWVSIVFRAPEVTPGVEGNTNVDYLTVSMSASL